MNEQVWTFSRDGKRLELKQTATDDGFLLSVRGDGPQRSYFFADLDRLRVFQADFEKFLLGTGWAFMAFTPERRGGRERRHYSRLITDRRRWWTDGAGTPDGHQLEGEDRRQPRTRRRQPR